MESNENNKKQRKPRRKKDESSKSAKQAKAVKDATKAKKQGDKKSSRSRKNQERPAPAASSRRAPVRIPALAILPPAQSQKRIAEKSGQEGLIKGGRERSKKNAVKVVFLGGVGEIGKNMTALECGDDIIIIDAGAIFPTEEMPGIDLVVPDLSYLIENRHKVRGLVLTHGHEDHIGGVPYLLKEMNIPVAGTQLTLALVDNKLREHRLNNVTEITVAPGGHLQWGCFKIDFINVNHSIAGALALAIHTPQGVIFHSGDFKIDLTPVAGQPIDLKTIADLGGKGVLLYMGESTNIERPGFTMSEAVVGQTLERLVGENSSRRIIIATFASNVHRLQQIVDIAVRHGRRVALNGRSMLNVVEAAQKIGELSIPEGVIVDISRTKNLRDDEVLIVCTGSQGEPMSALHRMANGENPNLSVGANDTIIISASPIPGNERDVYGVINKLYHLGADVVYERLENIHVSGHACMEEHKIMHTLLKPKFFIPVHGEYRHLVKHSQLAQTLGMNERNIFLPDLGNCVEVTSRTMRRLADVPSGSRLIDGEGIEDEKASLVMQDRRQLAQEGIFIVSVAVSGGEVIGEPVINSRGFVFDFHRDYNKEMREVIHRAIAGYDLSSGSVDELKRVIKKALRNYLVRKTKQSPMVVPVVVEL